MNEKILLTGGAGWIGSAVAKGLVEAGYQVVILDNFSTGQREVIPEGCMVVEGDILDVELLTNLFADQNFDAVMHFAAKKSVPESQDNPTLYYENNVVGSINLLAIMEQFGVTRIVFSSSASVYAPVEDNLLIPEDYPLSPLSVYGATKMMVEEIIVSYAETERLSQFAILRYFNVAGDAGLNYQEDEAGNLFPIIANKIRNGETLQIFGNDYDTKDGTGVRDYIHLKDLVDGHLKALESGKSGVFNLGTGEGYSVLEVVEAFNRLSETGVEYEFVDRRDGDAPFVVADPALAAAELDFHATHSLDEMVADTLRVYEG